VFIASGKALPIFRGILFLLLGRFIKLIENDGSNDQHRWERKRAKK